MKMADTEKPEELVDPETPPEGPVERAAAQEVAEDEALKPETSPSEKEGDSPLQTDPGLLSSMPCLLMELRRDSPESQQASTESEKPMSGPAYESDSSNPCMLSPSSSGHLADSDTLSSGEENAGEGAGASGPAEGGDPSGGAGGQAAAGARKSRRLRSESEMSTSTMAAKKNRWQAAAAAGGDKQNGRLAKVKGHRSQKHKERMRLLRQKREAAARKKYNLLQDSSTSDSDLTCDSSTSSSDDDEEVSGSSKTITADIPACRTYFTSLIMDEQGRAAPQTCQEKEARL
ncbi:protein ARK2N isoform X5 [Lepisosteus oculatus]|uniref:protein ARK2N isoform X5 n=1 Tax=Lepisosteus oculatus TaxID=7918 RepID=UPI00371E42F9